MSFPSFSLEVLSKPDQSNMAVASLPPEIEAALQRLSQDLQIVHHYAIAEEVTARTALDEKMPVLQNEVAENRKKLKQMEELMRTLKRNDEVAYREMAKLEEDYRVAVERRQRVEAFPNSNGLVDFVCSGVSAAIESDTSDLVPGRKVSSTAPQAAHNTGQPESPVQSDKQCASLTEAFLEKRAAKEGLESKPKRPRLTSEAEKASISFNEVYGDGNSTHKHKIVNYEGKWFILKCDEHGIHFPYNAVVAAGCHLRSHSHGGTSSSLSAVVKAFGIRVNDCSHEKAELNNKMFLNALSNGYRVLKSSNSQGEQENLPCTTIGGVSQRSDSQNKPLNSETAEEIVVALSNNYDSIPRSFVVPGGSSTAPESATQSVDNQLAGMSSQNSDSLVFRISSVTKSPNNNSGLRSAYRRTPSNDNSHSNSYDEPTRQASALRSDKQVHVPLNSKPTDEWSHQATETVSGRKLLLTNSERELTLEPGSVDNSNSISAGQWWHVVSGHSHDPAQ
ncbi:hypothetical protein CDEST_14389 [Colletotrichum destructivum]|uniref:Uncharacterized protein n=1 Tax=Colletotrichum destructivum TaxID=34406 RepID=A0AAX4J216_9PEZI|nr:hypothetical protein CDEST_14389 [Colletotrichum destructivum]